MFLYANYLQKSKKKQPQENDSIVSASKRDPEINSG